MASSDFKATAAVAIDGWVREREAVLRERKAYVRGALTSGRVPVLVNRGLVEDDAVELYPLPKIRRPRVYRASSEGGGWILLAIVDDVLRYMYASGGLDDRTIPGVPVFDQVERGNRALARDFATIAIGYVDLLNDPTVEVDDDGSAGGSL